MIFKRRSRPSRKDSLADLAPTLGMQFSEKDEIRVLKLLLDFKLFRIGGSKKLKNLLWINEEDLKTRIFDYQYTVSTGNTSQTYQQTVFFFYSKQLGLPHFRLQPEKFIHKVGAWLGWNDIDFATHEEFSDEYHLTGEDDELVRDTFTEPVLQYFSFKRDWTVEGLNYFLIIYRRSKRLPPPEIARHYRTAKEIFHVLKNEGFNV